MLENECYAVNSVYEVLEMITVANLNFILSFRVSDADGEVFSFPLYGYVPDTKTLAQLNGEMSNLATLVDAVLDGRVEKVGVCLDADLSGATIKGSAVSGSEIERTALINWDLAGSVRTWSVDIPAFKYADFLTGTNQVNLAQTDVAALISAIVTPTHFVFKDPSIAYSIAGANTGYKTFRKHRRQTKRT